SAHQHVLPGGAAESECAIFDWCRSLSAGRQDTTRYYPPSRRDDVPGEEHLPGQHWDRFAGSDEVERVLASGSDCRPPFGLGLSKRSVAVSHLFINSYVLRRKIVPLMITMFAAR